MPATNIGVDPQTRKATNIPLFSFVRPHMRVFHMSWMAFFLAFFGWFGIALMMAIVRDDLQLTKAEIGNTIIASVAVTMVARLVVGWLCDRIGPRITYSGLLIVGSDSGHDHRAGQQLRVLPALQAGDRHHRGLLRNNAVPHLRDVCSKRGGNGQPPPLPDGETWAAA